MKLAMLMLTLLTLVLAGCSADYECHVKSDTEWSATYGDGSLIRSGHDVIKLPDDACITVQKRTVDGYLIVQIFKKGKGPFSSDQDYAKLSTTAPYGSLSACTGK